MTNQTNPPTIEVETYQIGVAAIVIEILKRLDIVKIIDGEISHQPEVGASYGTLAQVVIINRLSFDPQPLYNLKDWAKQHGVDRLLGIDANWLDDDRMGALMEALAKNATKIWLKVIVRAVQEFKVVLEWLHADTTSVYFEGKYEDEQGKPIQQENAPKLVPGYNKEGKPKNAQMVLSLISNKHIPLWYKPRDGNQTDDEVYLSDMTELRKSGLSLENVTLVFDRKGCSKETMQELCQLNQRFLGAHPWTKKAKEAWEKLRQDILDGKRAWQTVNYVSRNNQGKSEEKRPQYRVCEVPYELPAKTENASYHLRWVFCWNSSKAELDAKQRQKRLQAGEEALQRVKRLLGKYDYTSRDVIEARIQQALMKSDAKSYYQYKLTGSEDKQDWQLAWHSNPDALSQDEHFDGIALFCTNIPAEQLSTGDVMKKYKEQVDVEQTFSFIKKPVQIRPLWLHSPLRIAGLTFLIMVAVLIASLIEYRVRQEIADNKKLIKGLMPENRDNPYPTAEKLLKAFQDYTIVLIRHADGREEIHYPKLRPVQQTILLMLGIASLQPNPI